MDVERFLVRQGWKKGEGLRPGSIKKPLLVKHRKNNKGLGFNPQASEGWWERVFDGHLKSLGVAGGSSITFEVDEEKRRRDTSPLYASFLSGGVLEGSIETKRIEDKSRKHKKEPKSKNAEPKDLRSKRAKPEDIESRGSKSGKSDGSAAVEPKTKKRSNAVAEKDSRHKAKRKRSEQ